MLLAICCLVAEVALRMQTCICMSGPKSPCGFEMLIQSFCRRCPRSGYIHLRVQEKLEKSLPPKVLAVHIAIPAFSLA